ncbi:MAG: FAD:protein FMN transferase [Candidatus Niyogibacteria bacterium]|nr:FAD:protein FMN transferase [Candidatus Niyogibacteria bacterium]
MHYEKWRALGSEAAIFLADADEKIGRAAVASIKNELDVFERRFSRFLPESELSRLNAAAGQNFSASAEMIDLLKVARELYRETDGIFDPLILPELLRAGYTKSFDTHLEIRFPSDLGVQLPSGRHGFSEVFIDEARGAVRLPAGAMIDLGGIGKGYAADRISEILVKNFKNFWISLGGDIRFFGDFKSNPWMVGVQDPFSHDNDLFDLAIGGEFCAVATSGTTKRRFTHSDGREPSHHIIDPRSGPPAASGIVAATVVADSAARADVLAKSALILGAQAGVELINKLPRAECLLIDDKGATYFSDGMRALAKPLK